MFAKRVADFHTRDHLAAVAISTPQAATLTPNGFLGRQTDPFGVQRSSCAGTDSVREGGEEVPGDGYGVGGVAAADDEGGEGQVTPVAGEPGV